MDDLEKDFQRITANKEAQNTDHDNNWKYDHYVSPSSMTATESMTTTTTKTGHHDIAEILLKVASNTINQSIKS
jgi:hypothetical protein